MVRVMKKDLIDYDLDGITIEYKGKEWTIPYGKFVSKTDIDNASDDTYIYIGKFGKWIVTRVGEEKNDYDRQYEKKKSANNNVHRDDIQEMQEIVQELERRINSLENTVKEIEMKLRA